MQDQCWSETRVLIIHDAVQCILEQIITDALDGHDGVVSIGCRQLTT